MEEEELNRTFLVWCFVFFSFGSVVSEEEIWSIIVLEELTSGLT